MEFGISVHVSSFYMIDSVMLVIYYHDYMSVFGVLGSLLLMPGVICLQLPLLLCLCCVFTLFVIIAVFASRHSVSICSLVLPIAR